MQILSQAYWFSNNGYQSSPGWICEEEATRADEMATVTTVLMVFRPSKGNYYMGAKICASALLHLGLRFATVAFKGNFAFFLKKTRLSPALYSRVERHFGSWRKRNKKIKKSRSLMSQHEFFSSFGTTQ